MFCQRFVICFSPEANHISPLLDALTLLSYCLSVNEVTDEDVIYRISITLHLLVRNYLQNAPKV